MSEGSAMGMRVILLLLGFGVAGGGYAIWRSNQPDAAATGDAPAAEVAAAAPVPTAPPATGEPATTPAAESAIAAAPAVDPEPAAAAAATAAPEPEQLAQPESSAVLPTFDVVRVAPDGATTIAGTAAPDAQISLQLDGFEQTRVQAGPDGKFVALFSLAPNPAPRLLSMVATLADGSTLQSAGTVAIAPIAAAVPVASGDAEPAPPPPAALLLTEDGAEVIQGPTPVAPGEVAVVSVDAITYAADGAVQLAGRGQADATLRIYMDNMATMDAQVGADGKWSVALPDTVPGVYTLRIDQLGDGEAVTSRFETPFKRETLEALAAASGAAAPVPDVAATTEPATDPEPATEVVAGTPAAQASEDPPAPVAAALVDEPVTAPVAADPDAAPLPDVAAAPTTELAVAETAPAAQTVVAAARPVTITVQPGFTLWGIADDMMGEGTMYVQVFEANRDKIRDPDLIYPGQVFTLPQE